MMSNKYRYEYDDDRIPSDNERARTEHNARRRMDVYAAIDGEREYQDRRWSAQTTETEGNHTVGEFIGFMLDYLLEANKQISRQGEPRASQDALNTLRKVTAMGVACMEQNGAPKRES